VLLCGKLIGLGITLVKEIAICHGMLEASSRLQEGFWQLDDSNRLDLLVQ
jgi:hypothetical protein